MLRRRGGFRGWGGGGGGGGRLSPLRDSTPCRPKGPPFDTFSDIYFWPTDPKIFLKEPLAQIYTNFEGERAPKKRDFFVKISQKVPRKFFQNRGKTVLWESSKSQFGQPKKKKFRSPPPPPPRENPRSAPAKTNRGGFRGGGGKGGVARTPPSSGIRPPADPKVPPLILFQISIFGRPTLKFF